jgi:hypothetical protein
MPTDPDGYEAYYADKLWGLLPEIHRTEDSIGVDQAGPLRELVGRIGAQAAVVRRSIDRTWEDQSIETCDDWVIAYIADLLATNLVASLDARGQRLDVARTIYYRRRKGTLAVLEQLASDITGWDTKAVEFFRRLARTRHGLDPEIGWPEATSSPDNARAIQGAQGLVARLTSAAIGGFADLRNAHGAALAHTAFDELFHTADVRLGHGATGWYNIPRLGVFAWRLKSLPVDQGTPVLVLGDCANQYTFDPTGRNIPLFAASTTTSGDQWVASEEHQLPGPISAALLGTAFLSLYAEVEPDGVSVLPRSLAVYRKPDELTPHQLVPATLVATDPQSAVGLCFIDPERGRLYLPDGATDAPRVGYHHGFSSTIGAGAYDRRVRGQVTASGPAILVTGGGTTALGDALAAAAPTSELLIKDSLTYQSIADVTVTKLAVRADNHRRPVVRPSAATWTFTGTPGSELVLDGLLISGCDVVLLGEFASVTLTTTTLDPGSLRPDGSVIAFAADGKPLAPGHLRIGGAVSRLLVDRCVLGPILTEGVGLVETLIVRESIVQSLGLAGEKAIDLQRGSVELDRSTLLGSAAVHRLEASMSILDGVVVVADQQHGCVRYSTWRKGSALPKQYECVALAPGAQLFGSRDIGNPAYAQLLSTVGSAIAEGAEDGSEMGAFWREKNAIKERSLRIKYEEYMPAGLSPVVVYVT